MIVTIMFHNKKINPQQIVIIKQVFGNQRVLIKDFKMKEIDVCSALSFKSCTAAVKQCVGFSAGSQLCGGRFCGLFTTSGVWMNLPVCVNSFIEQPAYGLQLFFHYQKMALNILCVTITAHTNQCSIDFSLCFFLFSMYSKQLALHSLLPVSAFLHIGNPYFFTPCSARITVPVCALGVQ